MKKLLLVFGFLACICFVNAQDTQGNDQISLQVGIFDPTQGQENPRSPMRPPRVYHDGNILYTQYVPFDVTLEVLDNGGTVVYTMFVPASTTSVVLPSTLSGTYEIQLIEGYWYFYGLIDL